MKVPDEFPVEIRKQNCLVKIYRSQTARGYTEYKVVWWDAAGKRKFKTFAEYDDAHEHATGVTGSINKGEVDALTIRSGDKAVYLRALDAVKPSGVALDLAAVQFADAHKKLNGRLLGEAVDFYVKRCPAAMPRKTVKEACDDFIATKEKDKRSKDHVKDLRFRLGKFSEAFSCQVSDVTPTLLNEWLRSLDGGGRNRNNFRGAVRSLFKFGEAAKYLPKDFIVFDKVTIPRATEETTEIGIFSPDQMVKLLNAARLNPDDLEPGFNKRYATGQGLLPLLALGGFCGLRTREVQRQKWSDINLERGYVKVTGVKGNTPQKRLVPIHDNAKQWLQLCVKKDGVCCDYPRTDEAIQRLAKRAGVEWQHNGLRHSYISYRVAETQDVPKVALESGNSPKMIFRNYRELVEPEDATVWFGIKPERASNVIDLSGGDQAAENLQETKHGSL